MKACIKPQFTKSDNQPKQAISEHPHALSFCCHLDPGISRQEQNTDDGKERNLALRIINRENRLPLFSLPPSHRMLSLKPDVDGPRDPLPVAFFFLPPIYHPFRVHVFYSMIIWKIVATKTNFRFRKTERFAF